MGVKPRKNIQKLHNVIHNTAARYGLSLMGVKPRKDIQTCNVSWSGRAKKFSSRFGVKLVEPVNNVTRSKSDKQREKEKKERKKLPILP